MRIAINLGGFLLKDDDWKDMVESLFKHLANKNPTDEFVFIVGAAANQLTTFPNMSIISLAFPANNRLNYKFWYDYKLPSLLKKEKIDVLVNTESVSSFRCSGPQILLVKDADFLVSNFNKTRNGFIKRRFQQSLEKAKKVIVFDSTTPSKWNKSHLTEKITDANLFANPIFKPMEWQEKEVVKEKFSEGKEYFLCKVDDTNPIDSLILLKAFSLFKKRQQSNMQLLIVGKLEKSSKNINTKIATYKYRNEVKLLDVLPKKEMLDMQAAAYCLLLSSNKLIDLPLLQAMQAGVPAILLQNNQAENIEDIALYADVSNAESIAEQMKIIYKDENLRNRIIAKGLAIATINTVETVGEKVWAVISTL